MQLLLRCLITQLLHRGLILGLSRSLRLRLVLLLKHLLLLELLCLSLLHRLRLYLLSLRRLLLLLQMSSLLRLLSLELSGIWLVLLLRRPLSEGSHVLTGSALLLLLHRCLHLSLLLRCRGTHDRRLWWPHRAADL